MTVYDTVNDAAQLRANLTAAEAALGVANNRVDEQVQQIDILRVDLTSALDRCDVLVRRVEELEGDRDQFLERIDRLNVEYADRHARVQALERTLHETEGRMHTALRQLDEFKTRVRDRMIREAEQRQWCREFDDILIEFGLEPRGGEFDVVLRFEGTFSRTVQARNAEYAAQLVHEELPFSEGQFCRLNGVEVYLDSVSTDSVDRQD